MFTKRQTATILAALRHYQGALDTLAIITGAVHAEIAADGGDLEPLDSDDIDALCERINHAPKPRVIVCVQGGAVTGVLSTVENQDCDLLDYDNMNAAEHDPANRDEFEKYKALDDELESWRNNTDNSLHGIL